MPIVAWRCPACLVPQPLDHFAATACGDIIHPDYAAAVLADDRDHEPSGKVATSGGLGCPRKSAIHRVEELTVNPLDFNSVMTGKAWHSVMEAHSDSPDLCEVEVGGKIMGLEIVGRIDRVRFATSGAAILEDWKHTNEWSFKRLAGEDPKPEHIIQLSIYAELYAQTFDRPASHGTIWHHATLGGFLAKRVDFWPMDQCLSYKPYGGEYSLADLWLQVQGSLEGDWRNLPLAGESMSFGSKSMCDYCAVRDVCWTTERGAPF